MLTNTLALHRQRCFHASLTPLLLFTLKPVFLLLLLQNTGKAYPQSPGLQYRMDFKKTETTYYAITDTAYQFSGPELVKLRKQIVIDSTIREVDLNNDITTTIYHLKDTQLEEWMTHPAKTIINKKLTVVLNDKGEVLAKSYHSNSYLNNYKQLKAALKGENADLIPTYKFVTDELISAFMESGYLFSDLGPEGALFAKDTVEIILNNNEMTDEVLIYSSSGVLQHYLKHGYVKNKFDQIVPDFTILKMWDERFAGNCVRKIVVTDFDGYKITYPDGNREGSAAVALGEVMIFPNPVGDYLNVKLPADYFKTATIEIMDGTGNVLLSKFLAEVQIDLIVPIAELNTGIYFMRMFDGKKEISKSFYKN